MPTTDELSEQHTASPPADLLQRITAQVAVCRDLQQRLADLEDQSRRATAALNNLLRQELPDLFDQAGTSRVDIPANGNNPGFRATLQPYFNANIAAGWSEEKRQRAFEWLEQHGHGDLIKTTVTIDFPREERAAAEAFVARFTEDNPDLNPAIRETVHKQTLTKWLKDQVQSNGTLPPLELIGGDIGRVVKLSEE